MTLHPTQTQRAAEVAEVSCIQLPPYRLEAMLLHTHYPSSAAVDSSVAGQRTARAVSA